MELYVRFLLKTTVWLSRIQKELIRSMLYMMREIKLYLTKPDNASGDMPGLLHLHGGGMAIMKADDPNYIYWSHKLASTGLIE